MKSSLRAVPGGYEFTIKDDAGKVIAHGWSAGSKRDADMSVEEWLRGLELPPTHDTGGES